MVSPERFTKITFLLASTLFIISAANPSAVIAEDPAASEKTAVKSEKKETNCNKGEKWISLFDGKTLTGWTKTKFGSEADVAVKEKSMIIEMGSPLTGVTITKKAFKKLPKIDYEMSLKVKREVGGDFFLGLTFPVKDDCCTLVLGGWGGSVIGLSSLDGNDASENETTTYHEFKNKVWYDVRLQVTKKKIIAWLGKEKIIDVDISDMKISTRIEVELSHPIGIATFQTTSHIQDFKMRPLTKKEQAKKVTDSKKE